MVVYKGASDPGIYTDEELVTLNLAAWCGGDDGSDRVGGLIHSGRRSANEEIFLDYFGDGTDPLWEGDMLPRIMGSMKESVALSRAYIDDLLKKIDATEGNEKKWVSAGINDILNDYPDNIVD